ncbi:MAG: hypothetical protein LBL90_04590 [Prevotellaceae bacterium]|jgi:hypothetical protein|nr:hypothetical protein [Prevotellaceae bacterium]
MIKYFVYIDSKRIGSHKHIGNVAIAENGKYAFCYRDTDDKYYANIDGKALGPYRWCDNVAIAENGKYAFSYLDTDGKRYANIDGKVFGPYHDCDNVAMAGNGKYAFCYTDTDGAYYANIDGKIIGPYKNISVIDSEKKDGCIFDCLSNDGNYYYVDLTGKIFGPFDDPYHVFMSTSGKYAYNEYRGAMVNPSFKLSGLYNPYYSLEIASSDREHSFFSNIEYEYVVIDGKAVGQSPALNVWYNKKNNSFQWNSIEGKDLLVYEYQLN